MSKPNIMLVAFYNKKALGVRYLETALHNDGYNVHTVFYKDFNSIHPSKTTKKELELLRDEISAKQPLLIGLSVMSSMYLDTIHEVIEMIQENFTLPVVCGGAYASMFPEHFLDRGIPYVVRCDGEHALCHLADALLEHTDYRDIPSLCYRDGEKNVCNEIGDVLNDIDGYGIPTVNSLNACFIENDTVVRGDPQLDTMSYEVIASRGCPFTCSYCACPNLRKILPRGVKGVRTRSVKSVIDELVEAKKHCKRIMFVHFYDEIFPNLPGWVDEFIVEYKKHVNLPFTIWSHPKMIDPEVMKKLVSVGLVEVIMGIQSGSEHIRRDIFHRYESQEDIIRSTHIIRDSGVFWTSYDFMLRHPFESLEDLKKTYDLVKQLRAPFELQLHGLNFLPGTDIIPMAIEAGYYTEKEMNDIMYAPMEDQFGVFWHRDTSRDSELWYRMIYCLQFKKLRKKVEQFEDDPVAHSAQIDKLYQKGLKLAKPRYVYRKSTIVLRRYRMKLKGLFRKK